MKKAMETGEGKPKDEFFSGGEMLVEPIFYAGSGVYDFQCLEFLPEKYKYDAGWLKKSRGFVFGEAVDIFKQLKTWLHEKSLRVNLYLKNLSPAEIEKIKFAHPHKDFDKHFSELMPFLELHQYVELFFDDSLAKYRFGTKEFRDESWKIFYGNLIDLFSIDVAAIEAMPGGKGFVENFSHAAHTGGNKRHAEIGDYNIVRSHPLIRVNEKTVAVPILFTLAEAIYESPFYWMMADAAYKDRSAKNRGEASEEISFKLLSKIFGNKAFRRVLVKSSKASTDTDIDVLCILGSKALCVQIKSQKLTELSRKGDDKALRNDFQRAVQDAYEQAKIVRQKILDRSSKFFNEQGTEIHLSEGIDEVFMLVVTTENYPSLAHQSHTMLSHVGHYVRAEPARAMHCGEPMVRYLVNDVGNSVTEHIYECRSCLQERLVRFKR